MGKLFRNFDAQFSEMSKEELAEKASESLLSFAGPLILAGITAENVGGLFLAASLLTAPADEPVSIKRKKMIEKVGGTVGITLSEDVLEITEEDGRNYYELIKVMVNAVPQFAMDFLNVILCFAHCDGGLDDETASKLEGIFSYALIADFASSGVQDVPSPKIKLTGFQAEIVRWFQLDDQLRSLEEIQSHFSNKPKSLVKSALDSLCQKGILYSADTFVGNMYGLTGKTEEIDFAVEPEEDKEHEKKLEEERKRKKKVKIVIQKAQKANVQAQNTAPLLKRAFMFLEDGEWNSANEYCEKVLDIDPENPSAYLGKLLSELRVRKQESLKDCAEPFDHSNNYQKAVRFADEKLKAALTGYIEHINTRNENTRLEGIYTRAKNAMSAANTESAYKEAAHLFETISEYQDSAVLAQSCYEKAEIARKDTILSEGKAKMTGEVISNYESAIKLLESISGWKDADEKIYACQKKIEEIKAKAEADRLEKERQAEIARKEAERIAKRNKKIAIITTPIVCAIIAFIIVLNTVIIPNNKYDDAIALMDAGKYSEAISAFEALNGHKDSADKINECNTAIVDGKYNDAIALMDAGNIVEAYEALVALEGYKDSADKANSIYDQYKVEKLKVAKAGDYVFFGEYEQDNNTANGKEDIEWLVLKVKDSKALVISKYALDCKPYNTSYTDVTWETCTLRKWLNNDFLGAAFSADEKAMIPTVTVSADKNPLFSSTNPGKATQDQVFLLSIKEANKFFSSDSARQCEVTDYAVANGAYVNSDNSNCCWWLRSPGYIQGCAACVDIGGNVYESGFFVDDAVDAVRPALWIDLNS